MQSRIFNKLGLVLIFLLLILVILRYSGVLSPIEGLFLKALNPIGTSIYGLEQKIKGIWAKEISREDYEKIKEENNRLIVENIKLNILKEENEELRGILNFTKPDQYKFLTAEILGRDPIFLNYFILNKGSDDGIKDGFPIVSPNGVLVGKIIKTEKKISTMIVPTDTNFETAVSVFGQSDNHTSGLVRGERGLGIKMEFIRQGENINKDDLVATSGLEFNMPKGLVVGRIVEVEKEDKVIFGTATVSPLVSYENLSMVMVILPQF
ncbi:hypothetical protein A2316_03320 [Candidatus Falkowbacteria bacterium RIFOXYB2_FULL_38_15]|uniref:Cell shape-determining protein MreC n=1 Tax=Candidatus Falkowbacteria bacterium RIFOXYA2_FULL_38_12 TaxID=1797993 RepID=A0A1F5S3Q4_9BACT|nr:MAG: hypothetical protein A2257_00915 [Candidatus Falkowbacteria bacterium RIFOXYA2_FULL_38_12]OGF33754.1 MAG: hypothetical protein A2316_03320 [Candidatus Falkowbacteria bacterium RIFOXYB2_FULL_38_15]OGF42377.1 MAG: hypothetical protein A2555_00315 [Candidatus Falkowbacteria bacterium RIFOXYD2_FULL_39_16]